MSSQIVCETLPELSAQEYLERLLPSDLPKSQGREDNAIKQRIILIAGRQESGKSNTARVIVQSLREHYGSKDVSVRCVQGENFKEIFDSKWSRKPVQVVVCIPKGETILTKFGSARIESINKNMAIRGPSGLTRVVAVSRRSVKEPLYEIKARCLLPMRLTGTHKILVCDRVLVKRKPWNKVPTRWGKTREAYWIEAQYIQPKKHFLVVPRLTTTRYPRNSLRIRDRIKYRGRGLWKTSLKWNITITKDVAEFLGYYVAEGFGLVSGVRLAFHADEQDKIDQVIRIAKTAFNLKATAKQTGPHAATITICSGTLKRTLQSLCGSHAREKKVPFFMFNIGKATLASFIRALFLGDGSVNKRNGDWELITASRTLALQVQMLLTRFGFVAPVFQNRHGETPSIIQGRKTVSRDVYEVRIPSKAVHKFKLNQYATVKYTKNCYLRDEQYFYMPVTKVNRTKYNGVVCDITTDSHEFLYQNAIVHNCEDITDVKISDDIARDFFRIRHVMSERTGRREGLCVLIFTLHAFYDMPISFRRDYDSLIIQSLPMGKSDFQFIEDNITSQGVKILEEAEAEDTKGLAVVTVRRHLRAIVQFPRAAKERRLAGVTELFHGLFGRADEKALRPSNEKWVYGKCRWCENLLTRDEIFCSVCGKSRL